MPHEGYIDPITECVTRAIEASDVSSTPLVAKTADEVTHETRPTPTEPNGVRELGPPDPNLGVQPTAQVAVRMDTGECLNRAHPVQK